MGFNRLLILKFSFLALRARTGQRVLCGTLPHWNAGWFDLAVELPEEERTGGADGH